MEYNSKIASLLDDIAVQRRLKCERNLNDRIRRLAEEIAGCTGMSMEDALREARLVAFKEKSIIDVKV